jgi:hypothetical protein
MTERDQLPAVVAAVTSRFVVRYTLYEDALVKSGHPHGDITAYIARLWHQLHFSDYEGKMSIFSVQRDIYTSVKNSPDYNSWRSNCAQGLAGELLRMLGGLLNPLLPPHATQHRDNVL